MFRIFITSYKVSAQDLLGAFFFNPTLVPHARSVINRSVLPKEKRTPEDPGKVP